MSNFLDFTAALCLLGVGLALTAIGVALCIGVFQYLVDVWRDL